MCPPEVKELVGGNRRGAGPLYRLHHHSAFPAVHSERGPLGAESCDDLTHPLG